MSKYPKLDHRKSGGGISVEEYGAIGDGRRDETQYFQRALDRFQHVYVPVGTYLVDGTLTASLDKQVIEGAGKGSVIKMMASKTYDLTKEHAALTMNAGEQTVQDLQLIGPDTGDDSTFSGSGSDWYNLSALRVDGPSSTVNGVKIDRCEGFGMHVLSAFCKVSLCSVERTGLNGLLASAKRQSVFGSDFTSCAQASYSNITTYPSDTTSGIHLDQEDCAISECQFSGCTKGITCKKYFQTICNNVNRDGLHVAAANTVVSSNLIGTNTNQNAITVANDGQSYISSLTGNVVNDMDKGGANDIIAPSSYSTGPVVKAVANENADIDRIYQQKAFLQMQMPQTGNQPDGKVPLNAPEYAQLINVDAPANTFSVVRRMRVQISAPIVNVNTAFTSGQFFINNEDTDSKIDAATVNVYNNSGNGNLFIGPTTTQTRLQPNTNYALYFIDESSNVADLTFEEDSVFTIMDLE